MHHGLRMRRTDRRPFRGTGPLPASVIDLLRDAAAPFGVATHVFDPEQVGFLAHAAREAAHIHDKSESYRDEMAAWTTYRNPVGRDGVPPTAAVPQVPRTVPVRNFAPDSQPLLEAGPGDDRYTTYLAFATDTDTRTDWLRAGEAVSAVLLTATTLGIASSVLSEVVEVPGARALLHALVAPAGFPQLTVRLGLNASGPEAPLTPRRPCSRGDHAKRRADAISTERTVRAGQPPPSTLAGMAPERSQDGGHGFTPLGSHRRSDRSLWRLAVGGLAGDRMWTSRPVAPRAGHRRAYRRPDRDRDPPDRRLTRW